MKKRAVELLVVIAGIGALMFFVVMPYRLNYAKSRLAAATDDAFQTKSTEYAVLLAERNIDETARWAAWFPDADLQIIRAANLRLRGRETAAAAAYDEIIRIEPTAEVYFNLGVTRWRSGDRDGAELAFALASRFDRSYAAKADLVRSSGEAAAPADDMLPPGREYRFGP